MTNIKPGFTELTLRAMAKPEDIDIRDYMVIPFKGKPESVKFIFSKARKSP